MSFYGQKTNSKNLSETRHLLESIKCYNFLNLDCDLSLLDDICINEEDFELLLDVIDIIGYDNNAIKLINQHLPREYDLAKFPKELLSEMLESSPTFDIISGNSHADIKLWNSKTGELVETLNGHTGAVLCVCCSPNGKYIASASSDGTVIIWNAIKYILIHKLIDPTSHHRRIETICYSHDSKFIVSGAHDIKIWNAKTGQLLNTLIEHTKAIQTVCYSPDNKFIISGSDDYSINIWNATSGKLIKTLHEDSAIHCVCYSFDNKLIASASDGTNIKIWNANTGELCETLFGHTDTIFSVSFSTDNKLIISGSADNSIKIWDAQKYILLNTLNGHIDWVWSVFFSADNKLIISGSADCTIKIWDTEKYTLINTLNDNNHIYSVCCLSKYCNGELQDKITKLLKN
jgi:WD40 repeat protein